MLKVLLISTFLIVPFISCQKDSTVGSINFKSETPVWLQVRINSISTDQNYYGGRVYQYEWNEKLIYHIVDPISSCAFCELYYHNGSKVQLTVEEFSDFMENRKNKVLIWEWDDE